MSSSRTKWIINSHLSVAECHKRLLMRRSHSFHALFQLFRALCKSVNWKCAILMLVLFPSKTSKNCLESVDHLSLLFSIQMSSASIWGQLQLSTLVLLLLNVLSKSTTWQELTKDPWKLATLSSKLNSSLANKMETRVKWTKFKILNRNRRNCRKEWCQPRWTTTTASQKPEKVKPWT